MDKYYKLLDQFGSLDSLFNDLAIDPVDVLAALDDANFIDVDLLSSNFFPIYDEDDEETQYSR